MPREEQPRGQPLTHNRKLACHTSGSRASKPGCWVAEPQTCVVRASNRRVPAQRSVPAVRIEDVAAAPPTATWSVHGRNRVRCTIGSFVGMKARQREARGAPIVTTTGGGGAGAGSARTPPGAAISPAGGRRTLPVHSKTVGGAQPWHQRMDQWLCAACQDFQPQVW